MAKDKGKDDPKTKPAVDPSLLAAIVRIEQKVDAALTRIAALQTAQSALSTKIDDTQALVLQIQRSL